MTNKAETVAEFLARGGIITKVDKQEYLGDKHVMPARGAINHDHLSLGEAEFMYGEAVSRAPRKKKAVPTVDFNTAVDACKLPQHIIDALKKTVADKKGS